ncbi:cysteine dioxygenase [Cupriavidus sp. AU9028]|uniref:cysteine dioxygenase family protein n=1 Tax=Cupriavidus sp. AU9028 TaxID=2871157 RepID=UPI001C986B5E|nr:cysteine dioxygenase [Cupriavidus sp. AU9028]MBY4896927.1 cysteine dioxygenase [Cupriavidus sp. AU9028]
MGIEPFTTGAAGPAGERVAERVSGRAGDITALRDFVAAVAALADRTRNDADAMARGARPLLHELVQQDGWLPDEFAQPHPTYYQQYLLYGDPLDRFSVVSFVWGPGQSTPVHDHTVWGWIGVLRGAEVETPYRLRDAGAASTGALVQVRPETVLRAGEVAGVSPASGDIHRVRNAFDDRVSVSIHLYGGNIGRIRRHVFDPASGERKPFVSGYANRYTPNLWPRDAG